MSINEYLKETASKLVISESEKSSITTSINTLEHRLSLYFGVQIKDKFIFGSYTRGTILPRKVDENSDIDYMIVFDNPNNYKPQTFLNKLKNFAEARYSTSEIYQSSPTIVLELNKIKFELVPAYYRYGLCYISDGQGGWMYTNPNNFNTSLVETNKNNKYLIKPIIRLVKYWNIVKNKRFFSSFKIEETIADQLKYAYFSCITYTDYLKKAFSSLKGLTYNNDVQERIDKAIDKIQESLEYENDNMPLTALSKIKQIIPEI